MDGKPSDGTDGKRRRGVGDLPWGWISLFVLFPAFGLMVILAVTYRRFVLAEGAILAIVVLILFGGARLTSNFLFGPHGISERERERESQRAAWLVRLVVVSALGLGAITLYAIRYDDWVPARVASTASVAMMTAGAAWLAGALLGFLFGIPHTLERAPNEPPGGSQPSSAEGRDTGGANSYKASTSLEQISDWLTKIIVGVSLTQLDKIPIRLDALASFVADGIGGGPQGRVLGLGILVYFSICGFLFGYLWARLYMLEAFQAAGTYVENSAVGSD